MIIDNKEYKEITITKKNGEKIIIISDNKIDIKDNDYCCVMEFDADPNNPDTYQEYLGKFEKVSHIN